MVFQTSTKGTEPQASSLIKKQETNSVLFLLAMVGAGLVLRKGASV